MLSKEVCKKCLGWWQEGADDMWEDGWVGCPRGNYACYYTTSSKNYYPVMARVDAVPPEACPYLVEHVVAQEACDAPE